MNCKESSCGSADWQLAHGDRSLTRVAWADVERFTFLLCGAGVSEVRHAAPQSARARANVCEGATWQSKARMGAALSVMVSIQRSASN